MYLIDKLINLRIGVQGENIATDIDIDMTTWAEQFPGARFHVLFKPYNEDYALPMVSDYETETHVLTWHVTLSATAIVGVGYSEIRAIDPDTGLIKKTRIVPTVVENSVTGLDGNDPPAPYQDWVDSVLAAKDDAYDYSEDSEAWAVGKRNGKSVKQTDPAWHNNSLWYKDLAEQALQEKGYMYMYIDEETGHLMYNATNDIIIDFEIEEGRLNALWPT